MVEAKREEWNNSADDIIEGSQQTENNLKEKHPKQLDVSNITETDYELLGRMSFDIETYNKDAMSDEALIADPELLEQIISAAKVMYWKKQSDWN